MLACCHPTPVLQSWNRPQQKKQLIGTDAYSRPGPSSLTCSNESFYFSTAGVKDKYKLDFRKEKNPGVSAEKVPIKSSEFLLLHFGNVEKFPKGNDSLLNVIVILITMSN